MISILVSLFLLSPWNATGTHIKEKTKIELREQVLRQANIRCQFVARYYFCDEGNPIAQQYFEKIAKEYGVLVGICCKCKKYLNVKYCEGGEPALSHGYCEDCYEEARAELRRFKEQRMAEKQRIPVKSFFETGKGV